MTYRIITIAQLKGGTGKTTIAVQLAVSFQKMGLKVAVMDIDPQKSFKKWNEVRQKRTGSIDNNLVCFDVLGWKLHDEIEKIKNDFDLIIIDTPPNIVADTKTAIRASDLVVIPMQPSPTDLWGIKDTLEIVNQQRVPHRILFNRVVPNSNLTKDYEQQVGQALETQLGNRVIYASSFIEGKSASEQGSNNIATEEISLLTNEISDLIFAQEKDLKIAV
jgi:chromosome partitioning protein